MRFSTLVRFTVTVGVFAMATRVSITPDSWWHLRAGQWMVEHGEILRSDPFSHTRLGEPWIYPGWVAQISLYGVYRLAGFAGLYLLTATLITAALLLLWPLLKGPDLWRAFVVILAAATSAVYWSARPQIFTFALAGLALWLLGAPSGPPTKRAWFFPLVMAFWANVHGGFAIGLLILGLEVLAAAMQLLWAMVEAASWRKAWARYGPIVVRWMALWVASILAVALNPHGLAMISYPVKTVSIQVLRQHIQEWQTPDFHLPQVQPFLWTMLALLAALAFSDRKITLRDGLRLALFLPMALMAGRNIPLFALVAAPPLAVHGFNALEPIRARMPPSKPFDPRFAKALNGLLAVMVALAGLAKVVTALDPSATQRAIADQAPTGAVRYMQRARPPGPMFNSYNWGGYLIWSLHPHYLTFVDGRTDLFGDELLRDYLAAWRGEESWRATLQRWGIRLVLLESHAPLVHVLQSEGWKVLYQDDQAILLGSP